MKSLKIIVIVVVLIIVCGLAGFCLGQYFNGAKVTSKKQDKGIIKRETSFSGETIKSGLKNMGNLQTAEYYYTHIEHIESERKIYDFIIPFTKSQYIYSYDGVITAGVDFSGIAVEVDKDNHNINIKLPRIKKISSEIYTDSFKLYDKENNIFNPISPEDINISLDELKKDEEKKAIKKGLFKKANKNALALVENFVKGLIPKDYEIKFVK